MAAITKTNTLTVPNVAPRIPSIRASGVKRTTLDQTNPNSMATKLMPTARTTNAINWACHSING